MKNFFLTLIAIFALSVICVFAQTRLDVIYLKNGDILKGVIYKDVPNDYIQIEMKDGTIKKVLYKDMEKREIEEKKIIDATKTDNESTMEKMMLYNSEKKDKGGAVALGLLCTSLGHAYAGNWGRGLLFSAGEISCILIALEAGFSDVTHNYYSDYSYTTKETNGLFYVGIVGLIGLRVWELFDAANEVEKYNNNLMQRIKDNKLSFGITPSKDNGLACSFSFKF